MFKQSVRSAVLFSLAAAIPVVAGAQNLEEVVVTARQRSESITDVPSSITAFSSSTIDRAGIERAEDFVALTPGVSMVDTAEVGDTQVSIRGINGARDAEANFAFIVDGILYTNPSAFNREFANLQQIEILKGPQGAQYGRSASAGAVIVTTQKPGEETTGDFTLSGGSQNSVYTSASLSGALVEDQLFGGVHVDFRSTDGFYKNTFRNNDKIVDDFENYNVDGRLIWEPRDDISFDLRTHYGEVSAASIAFNAVFNLPGAIGAFGPAIYEDVNEHDFVFQPNINPSNLQDSFDISLKMDWDLGWGTVTAWGLYSDIDQSFLADGTSGAFGFFAPDPVCAGSLGNLMLPGGMLPPPQSAALLGPYTPTTCDGYQYQVRNQEDYSFEVRLSSRDDQPLRWQVGGYFLDLEREVGVSQLRDDNRRKLPESLINPLTEALVYDRFDTRVWALFGNVQYDVTDTVEVSAALRYDNERREVTSLVPTPAQQRSNFIDYTAPGGFLLFPLGALSCDDGQPGSPLNPAFVNFDASAPGGACVLNASIPDREETFDHFQPKVTARWDMTDEVTVFASWGRGFKSGGFNNQGSQSTINLFFNNPALGAGLAINDQFDQETSDAFELGFKSNYYGGRLQIEGALFYTMVEDMQIFNFFVGPFGLLRVVSNIDEVDIAGGEIGTRFSLTDQLDIYGSFAYTWSEIKKNSNRPQTVGNRAPYAPDYTANVGAEFIQPAIYRSADLIARVDYNRVGPTWFSEVQDGDRTPNLFTPFGLGLADQSRSRRDAYGLLNMRLGLQMGDWGVFGYGRNILDTDYLAEVIPAPEFGGAFAHPGRLREWGVEVTWAF